MAERQKLIDFERAQQLWMLEHLGKVTCGCAAKGKRWCSCWSTVKSVLAALDCFARNAPTCTVTIASIGRVMGKRPTATKTGIKIAAQLGYISVLSADDARGAETDRQRSGSMSTYRINWVKIWYETEEIAPQRIRANVNVGSESASQESDSLVSDRQRRSVRNPTTSPLSKSDHVPSEIRPRTSRNPTTSLLKSDHVPLEIRPPAPPPPLTTNAPNTAIIASEPPAEFPDDGDDGGEDSWKPEDPEPEVTLEDAVDMLRAVGVERARAAVNVAEAHGMTPAGIVAVARHALAHPGRWNPQVIYTRVTSLDAIDQPPDEGWFGENPNWRPATAPQTASAVESGPSLSELEREHLATLQAMNLEELQTLLPFIERRMQGRVTAAIARKEDPRTTTLKGLLLEALHRRRQRDGPSATSTA